MTFYDDAEFAAIKMARLAVHETGDRAETWAMLTATEDFFDQHGSLGLQALCLALGRQYGAALTAIARNRGCDVDEVVDEFEQHKLEQIEVERRVGD